MEIRCSVLAVRRLSGWRRSFRHNLENYGIIILNEFGPAVIVNMNF